MVKDKAKIDISSKESLLAIRKQLNEFATKTEMNSMSFQALSTASTELVTNILKYANCGDVSIELVQEDGRVGVRALFVDQGPGIEDIDTALVEGYSSSSSLGHGLSGVKRLVDRFDISSEVGVGTRVEIIKWK